MRTYTHYKFAKEDMDYAQSQGDVCYIKEALCGGRRGWGVVTLVAGWGPGLGRNNPNSIKPPRDLFPDV